MLPPERRRHERIRGPFDAVLEATWGRQTVRIIDISVTGCFVDVVAQPALNERLRLTIHFPQTASVAVDGRVVYVDRVQGFGVEFLDVPAASQQALAATIARFSA